MSTIFMRDKLLIDWLYTLNMHVKQTQNYMHVKQTQNYMHVKQTQNYMHGIIHSGDFNLMVWQILPKSKQITYDTTSINLSSIHTNTNVIIKSTINLNLRIWI